MLENYLGPTATHQERQRVIAVEAALDIIKATLSDTNDGNGVSFQLQAAEKHIKSLADAIQNAIEAK